MAEESDCVSEAEEEDPALCVRAVLGACVGGGSSWWTLPTASTCTVSTGRAAPPHVHGQGRSQYL